MEVAATELSFVFLPGFKVHNSLSVSLVLVDTAHVHISVGVSDPGLPNECAVHPFALDLLAVW